MSSRDLLIIVFCAVRQCAAVPLVASQPSPPNFVFVLGEGHGWSSTSVQMDDAVADSKSRFVRTPNMEKLAQAGMRLASFYAPSPRCTPSRATYLTGRSPAELHMTFVGEGKSDTGGDSGRKLLPPRCILELPEATTTVAELLKGAGYATAHLGKWHLGRVSPTRHGFDESDGATSNGGPDNVANPHPKQLYGMTERGMKFIERQTKAGKPFFLQLSHYASRQGGDSTSAARAAVRSWGAALSERDSAEAAATFDLDIAFGMLLKKLDELGIAHNTYVIFTTDHGTPGKNPPLTGGKGGVWEGGLRVPCIIRGPGIKPGACSRVIASGADLFPTIAALAQIRTRLPDAVEGGNLLPVLTGGEEVVKRPRAEFVVHFPHYDRDSAGPASAILLGDYKLIRFYETGATRLFSLNDDPGERNDLAARMPVKAQELDHRLSAYLNAVKSQMPTDNPDYDPRMAPTGGHQRKGPAYRSG